METGLPLLFVFRQSAFSTDGAIGFCRMPTDCGKAGDGGTGGMALDEAVIFDKKALKRGARQSNPCYVEVIRELLCCVFGKPPLGGWA